MPNKKITREEAMLILTRAMKIAKLNVEASSGEINQLTAKENITRAQTASIVKRLLKKALLI